MIHIIYGGGVRDSMKGDATAKGALQGSGGGLRTSGIAVGEADAVWVGVDVGACATKVVVIDARRDMRGYHVLRSGVDYAAASREGLEQALDAAGVPPGRIRRVTSTGYGRNNVPFADEVRTEIGCHMKGCFHYYPHAATIVDIGGQDCKVIHVDDRGRRVGFKMNRKCAAGTGAFLEETALRLGVDLSRLDSLARGASKRIRLGAYCTVFSATEILALIRRGESLEDIARGLLESVVQRILEMDPLEGTVILSGGVIHHNPFLARILEEKLGREVVVPPRPQFMGAFGAALYALEGEGEEAS